ncbi:triple functional domain protein-like [Stigmatopora argus]
MHLSMLEAFDECIESQGDLLLQYSFKVWDSRIALSMGKNGQIFLLKSMMVCKMADIKLTEHLERDPHMFAFLVAHLSWRWSNIVLKASTIETKLE